MEEKQKINIQWNLIYFYLAYIGLVVLSIIWRLTFLDNILVVASFIIIALIPHAKWFFRLALTILISMVIYILASNLKINATADFLANIALFAFGIGVLLAARQEIRPIKNQIFVTKILGTNLFYYITSLLLTVSFVRIFLFHPKFVFNYDISRFVAKIPFLNFELSKQLLILFPIIISLIGTYHLLKFVINRFRTSRILTLNIINTNILSFFGAIIYTFNPLIVASLEDKLFWISVLLFPLFVLAFCQLVLARQFKFNWLILFGILFFLETNSPAFLVYACLFLLAVFLSIICLSRQHTKTTFLLRGLALFICGVIASLHWLLPVIATKYALGINLFTSYYFKWFSPALSIKDIPFNQALLIGLDIDKIQPIYWGLMLILFFTSITLICFKKFRKLALGLLFLIFVSRLGIIIFSINSIFFRKALAVTNTGWILGNVTKISTFSILPLVIGLILWLSLATSQIKQSKFPNLVSIFVSVIICFAFVFTGSLTTNDLDSLYGSKNLKSQYKKEAFLLEKVNHERSLQFPFDLSNQSFYGGTFSSLLTNPTISDIRYPFLKYYLSYISASLEHRGTITNLTDLLSIEKFDIYSDQLKEKDAEFLKKLLNDNSQISGINEKDGISSFNFLNSNQSDYLSSRKLGIVLGSFDIADKLLDIFPKNGSELKFMPVFIDQLPPSTRNETLLNDADIVVLNNHDTKDLAFSIMPSDYFVAPVESTHSIDPNKEWMKASVYDPLDNNWLQILTKNTGLKNWDFDFNRGLIYALNPRKDRNIKQQAIQIPITSRKGEYEIYTRHFISNSGGSYSFKLDNSAFNNEVKTTGFNSGFQWQKIGDFSFSGLEKNLVLQNKSGFNAINLIAFIPKEELPQKQAYIKNLVSQKQIISFIPTNLSTFLPGTFIVPPKDSEFSVGVWHPYDTIFEGLKLNEKILFPAPTKNGSIDLASGTLKPSENLEISNQEILNKIMVDFGPYHSNKSNKIKQDLNNGTKFQLTDSDSISSKFVKVEPGTGYELALQYEWRNIKNITVKLRESSGESSSQYSKTYLLSQENTKNGSNKFDFQFTTRSSTKFAMIEISATPISFNNDQSTLTIPFAVICETDAYKTLVSNISYLVLIEKTLFKSLEDSQDRAKIEVLSSSQNRYNFHIPSSKNPTYIAISEPYNSLWTARKNKHALLPIPVFGVLNAFKIGDTADSNFTIEYYPHYWFEIGLIIELCFLFFSLIIWIIYKNRRVNQRL